MDRFNFFNDWYDKEEKRKTSLESSLNIPIGILTILFALQFYIVKEFDFKNSYGFEFWGLLVLIVISTSSALLTAFYLLKSYHNLLSGYNYHGLPYPTQLLDHEKQLNEFYQKYKDFYQETISVDKFEEYLTLNLARLIENNAFNNDKKSEYLHNSKAWIFVSILTLFLATIPFFTNSMNKTNKPQKIEIVNDSTIYTKFNEFNNRIIKLENMADDNKDIEKKESEKTPPLPPLPPPNRIIKEGSKPPAPPQTKK